jgi:ABC-2 type transport system ATP-binding protein
VIETRALTQTFGDVQALKGIDLRVEAGDVYGFIGPNGAGKTTTIRILTTLQQPTSGQALIDGIDVWERKDEVRGLIGYLPDDFGVYRDMTVDEYLQFFAAAYGLPTKGRDSLIGGLLELTDLSTKRHALVDNLSRGMQQRLGLARTLVHDPKVLILDEPASGLDPRARIEIREVLRELQRMGKTILLSSHILSELQSVCTRIGVLEQGQLVAQGRVDEIIAAHARHGQVWLRTTDDARAALVLLEVPGVLKTVVRDEEGRVEVDVAADLDLVHVSAQLHRREIGLRHLERREPSLEEVFMALTKGLVA